jgi:uncharacterized membrane protein YphA (DoxX/SURF4 family)
MKKTKILYWVFTILLAVAMLLSALESIVTSPKTIEMIHTQMGYPIYFIPFTGIAKTLGVIALFIPGMPRLKEWVFAGFSFDIIAAIYSFICLGYPITQWWPMLIYVLLIALAYYYHRKRTAAVA